MNNTVKIGIIGCGRVAQHYKVFFKKKNIKNASILFCCDLDIEKAKHLGNSLSSDYGISFKKLIKKHKINLALILTESGKHFEHAKFFLDNNINVLIEKPATFNYEKSNQLHHLSKKNKLLCCVGFQNRFNPSIKLLKNVINKKRLGKIITVSVKINWCRYQEYYNDKWHGTWIMDGGVTNQQAIHHIDILTYLFGPALEVVSFMKRSLNKLEAEDTAIAIIKFKSNIFSTFEATTAARPEDYEASITIVGEKGRVKIGGIALNKVIEWKFIKTKKSDINLKKKFSQKVKNGYGLSHKELLNNLVHNINNPKNKKEYVNINSTFSTTNLISGLYKSFEKGKIIKINNKTKSIKLGVK